MVAKTKRSKYQENFELALSHYPHLKQYIEQNVKRKGIPMPKYYTQLDYSMRHLDDFNLIYPVGEPLFVHVLKLSGETMKYIVIEPVMDREMRNLFNRITDKMIAIANELDVPDKTEDLTPILIQILNKVVAVSDRQNRLLSGLSSKIILTQAQYDMVKYYLIRERVGFSKLEPLFNDPYLEDIHCTGVGSLKAIHKIFDMIRLNISFSSDLELNKYIIETSERVEKPVSEANPVVDAVMPDGSRVNFIYGREISREGSSFTVRKFSEVPISITEIINFGTMNAEVAAYLWLCLENGMNVFICGETASGKTTTLNASAVFIKPDAKIYSVEGTAEVTLPHDTWQHLVTREANKETDVDMFTLLIAALRSRPNYIIVGEIRGKEGNVAFQAMQTGHPVVSTFHAGAVHSMIQRITGNPINVPIAFIDNLNVVVIQSAVSVGTHYVRRAMSVTEIERYYEVENKVITRQVFTWDHLKDQHRFSGYYNSYLLEKKIAPQLGLADPKDIYKELELRKQILQKLYENKIFNYFEVWDIIKKYWYEGAGALPFELEV